MTATQSKTMHLKLPKQASNALNPEQLAAELETLLDELLVQHEKLLEVTLEHRAALAQADRVRMSQCVSKQLAITSSIEQINRRRAALLVAFRPGVSLREVQTAIGPAATPRLKELGELLKEVVLRLRREQERLRLASASLASHMQGLIQQIHHSLSHAGVYSTHGRVEAGAMVVSGLDVTS